MAAPTLTPEVVVTGRVTVIGLGEGFQIVDERVLETGLGESLLGLAADADPPLVVLDLSHTRFFGSSFIEILFRLWTRLQARDSGAFAISGLTPYCLDVLKITHLDTLWRLFPTKDDAVRALSGGN